SRSPSWSPTSSSRRYPSSCSPGNSVTRRSTFASLLLLFLASCHDRSAAPLASSAAPPTASAPDAAPSARRPTRRCYLGRTENRCEVFWVDGDQVSPPQPTPCPPDLLPGERIRIAGMTCLREGSDPERRVPVVCPDPLTNQEKRDLAARTAP